MIHTIGNISNPGKTPAVSGNNVAAEKKTINDEKSDYAVSLNEKIAESVTYNEKAMFSFKPGDEFFHLGNIVKSLLERQGTTFSDAIAGVTVEVDEEARQEALELISEEGYWGVEQTSERIFKFAVNSAGNDPGKLDEIKAAIEKGFEMALDAFGGTLPEISHQTHDAVMEKLDEWSGSETDSSEDEL